MSKKGFIFIILSMMSSIVFGQSYTVDTSNAKQDKSPPPRIGSSPFVGQTVEEVKKSQAASVSAPAVQKQELNSASKQNNADNKKKPKSKTKTSANSTNTSEPLNSNNTGTTTSEQSGSTTGSPSSHAAEGEFNRGY